MAFSMKCNHQLLENMFKATFRYARQDAADFKISSENYTICGIVTIQLYIDVKQNNRNDCKAHILMKFNRCYVSDTMEYVIKLSSANLKLIEKCFYCEKQTTTVLLGTYTSDYSLFGHYSEGNIDISIVMSIKENPKFSSLYSDTELTDFELIGEDGSLPIHKLVLADQSPVMKTMFSGDWKETNEGRVSVPGISVKTLEQLKKYLYFDQLPDGSSDLELLLAFAYCYMMKNVIQACCTKILFYVTAENATHYIELAIKYKLRKLLFGTLQIIHTYNFDNNLVISSCRDDWL